MEDLEDTKDFDEVTLPDVVPIDDDKYSSGDKFLILVVEGDENSHIDSPPPVHVDITKYQSQMLNVNHIKYKLSKTKTLCVVQKHC